MHNDRGSYWSLVLGLGTMDEDDIVLDNGLMFSVYESGPWVGYKFTNNPAIGWIGAGTEMMEFMVKVKNMMGPLNFPLRCGGTPVCHLADKQGH